MKTRWRRNVSEDRLTITQRNTRSKKSTENERRENSLPIPIDLIMEIFSRLSAKSIARCRCVSKPWDSILGRSDFKELFSTRSSARPQLLFACERNSELFFFSSPQPQHPDENSSPLVVNYHMKFSFDAQYYYYSQICRPVHGLVCFMRTSKVMKVSVPVIYNPSTGQSLLLPKVKTRWVGYGVRSLLGYDPIDKQFKLLYMIYGGVDLLHVEHQVLTLGTGNHSWRIIKCCRPHYSPEKGICIDGVLYYIASGNSYSYCSMVVCFEVRSEKFRFIQVEGTFIRYCVLINYNGKLGLLASERSSWVSGSSRSIELRVLEDAQKHEWSKHTYVLSATWKNIVGNNTLLYIVGMTRTNEIVLATSGQTVPFYVFYYNIERKTTIRLQIQGMEGLNNIGDYRQVFLNHVEDLKLI